LAHVQTHSDAVSDVEWIVSIDTTIVRAHQHAAGARKGPSPVDLKRGASTSKMRLWEEAGED
jgi:hypothetical protein